MTTRLRSLVSGQHPEIKINLSERRQIYSTGDRIQGTVTITAPTDTPFDELQIDFAGVTRTQLERMSTAGAVAGRPDALHQFLKLTQPELSQHYPPNRVLKAGKAYNFPFLFVIPQQLLPRVCTHKVQNPLIRDAHLALPPTMGDREHAKKTKTPDDMTPEMASIRYGVFAKLVKTKIEEKTGEDGEKVYVETGKTSLAARARKLRVVPKVDEQPPLMTGDEESDYIMRKEKPVRKGLIPKQTGTLVLEAEQPNSLHLQHFDNPEFRVSTHASITLRFDPVDGKATPPKLQTLHSKLKVKTFYASTARYDFPAKPNSMSDLSQGYHVEQINLSDRCVANVEWERHDAPKRQPSPPRRDSACSAVSLGNMGSTPAPSKEYKGGAYFTARLLVPISLPINKTFIPTFHSCLVSRIYQLRLSLEVSGNLPGQSANLKLPIQISADYSAAPSAPMRRNSASSIEEDDLDEAGVEDFFRPRPMTQPVANLIGRGRIGQSAPQRSGVVSSSASEGELEDDGTGPVVRRTEEDAPPEYRI